MTVRNGTLPLAMGGNTIELLDAASAAPVKSIVVQNLTGLAFDDAFARSMCVADGKLDRLDAQSGRSLTPIPTPGSREGGRHRLRSRRQNIVVADLVVPTAR